MLNIFTIFRCILTGILVPYLAGVGLTGFLFKDKNHQEKPYCLNLIAGYLLIWTVTEIVAVPLTILKGSFSILIIVVGAVMTFACIWAVAVIIKNNKTIKDNLKNAYFSVFKTKSDMILFAVFVALFVILAGVSYGTLFTDADDSRFLVNAGDILRTNRILSTDPVTGGPIDAGYRDFKKDLVGQWSAFIALGAKLAGVEATVFAHTVYPFIAFLLTFSIYWILLGESDVVTGKKPSTTDRSLAMILLVFFMIYGDYSSHSQETMSIIRVWQGKATMALFGTLTVIYVFSLIHRDEKKISYFILLLLINISMILMSSMGVVVGTLIIGAYGLYTAIAKRSVKTLIFSALVCVPNAMLFVLSEVYTLERFLEG